jgi:hypothetical protein
MADQPSKTGATSPKAMPLPGPILDALSYPGIDLTRFGAVIEAFGPLPIDGQVKIATRLVGARGQYLVDRMWVCDGEIREGVCRKRLNDIGVVARRLLRLLHRDELDHQPGNLHPAITLALPRLFQFRSDRIWDHGLGQLGAMLADLARAGAQADEVFPAKIPKQRGGKHREGPTPATGLIGQLIEIYQSIRDEYPESGPAPAFDASLRRFVRAGLDFAVSEPPETIDPDGQRWQLAEVKFLETDLPTRVTADMIRGVFDRLHKSNQK